MEYNEIQSILLNNLLGKMRITCNFRDRGCPVVMPLESLRQHTDKCPFSIRLCNKCFCLCKINHNCVEELMALNKKESERYEELMREKHSSDKMRDQLMDENMALKKEMQELRKNFEKITHKYTKQLETFSPNELGKPKPFGLAAPHPLVRTNSTQSLREAGDMRPPSIYEMLSEARKHLNQRVSVTECNTTEEAANKVVDCVKNEIRNNNNMYYICQNIVYKLDLELGSSWCVITNWNKQGHNYTNSSCYVKLKFGKLTFKIYRTKFLDVPLLRRRVRDGKIVAKIQIFDTDMSDSMIKFVETVTFVALRKHKTMRLIAGEVKSKMDAEYSGQWNCFAHNFGDYCVNKKEKTFISFDVDELKITLFQAN
ncbi:unnamed protein product [Oppiella nova]|uniref:TRAF-type domain-containing protein n=1 Tax=Oppiella nova TaxID=334625 RepID=A0A7R9QPT0_9ACAR|nr:unnamed protein product [Oppiella nova]CAG2169304.1 unnamed protein product [Oppiella nova]